MDPIAKKLVWVALAGAAGTCCRYLAELGISKYFSTRDFPWSIGLINIAGCLLFGWAWTFSSKRMLLDSSFRLIVLVGFLGAFTTFSTYAFQALQLVSSGKLLAASGYFLLNNVGGFAAAAVGMAIGSR